MAQLVREAGRNDLARVSAQLAFYLEKFKASGGTPARSSSTSTAHAAHDDDLYVRKHNRSKTFVDAILRRDDIRCLVTHKGDFAQAQRVFSADEFKVWHTNKTGYDSCKVCHIIPHSSGKDDLASQAFIKFWSMFSGFLLPYVGADVDKVENGFVLSHYMHLKQGSFDIAFKQLENHTYLPSACQHTYEMLYSDAFPPEAKAELPQQTIFTSHNGSPLPDPNGSLLGVAVFNLLRIRGKADVFDPRDHDGAGDHIQLNEKSLGYLDQRLTPYSYLTMDGIDRKSVV